MDRFLTYMINKYADPPKDMVYTMNATETIEDIFVYAHGMCYLSACVKDGVSTEHIETVVNQRYPTGISSRWAITDESFKTGEPNPCPCDKGKGRQHYLLSC